MTRFARAFWSSAPFHSVVHRQLASTRWEPVTSCRRRISVLIFNTDHSMCCCACRYGYSILLSCPSQPSLRCLCRRRISVLIFNTDHTEGVREFARAASLIGGPV